MLPVTLGPCMLLTQLITFSEMGLNAFAVPVTHWAENLH